jgi:hypothetical protein
MDSTLPKMQDNSGGDSIATTSYSLALWNGAILTWDPAMAEDFTVHTILNGKGDHQRQPLIPREEVDKKFEGIFGQTRKHVCRQFVRVPNSDVRRCYYCDAPEEAF